MERVDFQMRTVFGSVIRAKEYTEKETGEVKMAAPKVQLLQEDEDGRFHPFEMKQKDFEEQGGVAATDVQFGQPVSIAGIYLIRDGFPIVEHVTVGS